MCYHLACTMPGLFFRCVLRPCSDHSSQPLLMGEQGALTRDWHRRVLSRYLDSLRVARMRIRDCCTVCRYASTLRIAAHGKIARCKRPHGWVEGEVLWPEVSS